MNIVRSIKNAADVVRNPDQEYERLPSRTLEDVLEEYITLVLCSGFIAGVVSLAWGFARAIYLDLVRSVHIDYWRLFNYQAQVSVGTFFFYLFAGTVLFFLVSLLVLSLRPKSVYTQIVMILCYATYPVLLFGWINKNFALSLVLWSVFILYVGLRHIPSVKKTKLRRAA